jgi:type IV pilus assembly protein PilO
MDDLFDRIAGLRLGAKLGILALIVGLIAGGYWYFIYSDMTDEARQSGQVIDQLTTEKNSYLARKKEYQGFRLEVTQLLDEQKELLRVLPKKDDIEQFIENVNAQVELAGLSKVASVRDAAVPEQIYLRIPIKMSVTGSYHQINRFFRSLVVPDANEKKRIVNITDLQLASPGASGGGADLTKAIGDNTLKADFVASTFQFLDKAAAPAAATGAPR